VLRGDDHNPHLLRSVLRAQVTPDHVEGLEIAVDNGCELCHRLRVEQQSQFPCPPFLVELIACAVAHNKADHLCPARLCATD
jgi:hypothetical protein